MADIPDRQVSRATGDLPLFLSVRDRGPYTTTLHMTYMFEDGSEPVADPDLSVRVYHDARMAETLHCATFHRHAVLEPFTTGPGKAMDQRWIRNMMLNKWLEYCADTGHRFSSDMNKEAVRA
jgi:uncharacterized protein YqiB (DUF1249 family)